MAIRKRIRELGLSQPKVSRMVGRSASWLATQVLPDPENAIRYLWAKDPEAFNRLLRVLQWTPEEFSRETGIQLPGAEIPGSIPLPALMADAVERGEVLGELVSGG